MTTATGQGPGSRRERLQRDTTARYLDAIEESPIVSRRRRRGSVALVRPSQVLAAGRRVGRDPLYRGSVTLLGSNVVLAVGGLIFWTIATNAIAEEAIGRFSGISGALALLVAFATLGLPTSMLRFLPHAGSSARLFVANSLAAVATIGLVVSLGVAYGLTLLPGSAGTSIRSAGPVLLAGLAALLATGSVCGSALVAARGSGSVLVSSIASTVFKVVALVGLATSGLRGLLAALAIGACAQVALSCAAIWRRTDGVPAGTVPGDRSERVRFVVGSYLGGLVGILPLAGMPLLVLAVQGERRAAYFGTAWLIVSALGFVAGAASQASLSEMSRAPERLRLERNRALCYVYSILGPTTAVVFLLAPLLMGVFGPTYSAGGTNALRLLAVGSLVAAGNYVFDALIAVSVGGRGYFLINLINSILVIGGFAAALPLGLGPACAGWAAGQAVALIAAIVIASRSIQMTRGESA